MDAKRYPSGLSDQLREQYVRKLKHRSAIPIKLRAYGGAFAAAILLQMAMPAVPENVAPWIVLVMIVSIIGGMIFLDFYVKKISFEDQALAEGMPDDLLKAEYEKVVRLELIWRLSLLVGAAILLGWLVFTPSGNDTWNGLYNMVSSFVRRAVETAF